MTDADRAGSSDRPGARVSQLDRVKQEYTQAAREILQRSMRGVAKTTLRLTPRRVSDTPSSALAATAAVTPGTISKPTPAALRASISS